MNFAILCSYLIYRLFQFMGIVEEVGPGVKNISAGQRVVASFQIACGDCRYCKEKLSSFCDNSNNSSYVYWIIPM